MFANHQCFKRFGSYLEDAGRFFEEVAFGRFGGVAVPTSYGDVSLFANGGEAVVLVVDEGFQWGDVQDANSCGRIFVH